MGDIKTHCLIVNYKNVTDFKNLVSDVLKQDVPLKLTVVDQKSEVPELDAFYKELENNPNITIVRNISNQPLNHVWNWFAENHNEEYLAFLNNDIRIPSNFVRDSEELFAKEPTIGITCHVTNNPAYVQRKPLEYIKLAEGWQGWDFTVRKKWYSKIPEKLEWFGGDAHIFEGILYERKMKLGFLFSSPIVHHQGKTKTPERNANRIKDSQTRRDMNAPTPPREQIMKYTIIRPHPTTVTSWIKHN